MNIDLKNRITYPILMTKKLNISSMTGFARSSGSKGTYAWIWEARSVNGKGLDIRCRLPHGMDELELKTRGRVGNAFTRGNIALNLSISEDGSYPKYKVNHELLDQLVELESELSAKNHGWGGASPGALFTVKGVIEPIEEQPENDVVTLRNIEILEGLDQLLDELLDARLKEGERISITLNHQLDEISRLKDEAATLAEIQPIAIKKRIMGQFTEFLEAVPALSEERIAQEVALLVTKADVREELDRLGSHLAAAVNLLSQGGVIGRKLDFLCQECNREVNTICSKAQNIELTNIGLELKAVIEQFREQVQNIE